MEVEVTNPDVLNQQSSDKINTPINEQKKEKNATEMTNSKTKVIHQSDTSDVTKGKIQEDNTIPSAHFKSIIHLNPKKIRIIQKAANKETQVKSTKETQ